MNEKARKSGYRSGAALVWGGALALLLLACGESTPQADHPTAEGGGCEFQGGARAQGERWNDGCNDCSCGEDGLVSCTERACLPPEEQGASESAEACVSSADCQEGYACFPTSGCQGPGQCSRKPEACTMQYDPVCGCDGKTYGNACGAAGAGVAVAARGECGAE